MEIFNNHNLGQTMNAASTVSARVNTITWRSTEVADMEFAPSKTKVLQIDQQDPVGHTTPEEAKTVSQFPCLHKNYNFVFVTKKYCSVYVGRCK